MQPIGASELADIVGGTILGETPARIGKVCTDSRRAEPGSVFFALEGEQTDGHEHVGDAWRNGAAVVIVRASRLAELRLDVPAQKAAIVVDSPLAALHTLARWFRATSIRQVIAITGSNGKTVVKDALVSLIGDRSLAASPGSFNSQLGVPLAVLAAERSVDLGVFEAGISLPGEMDKLREILQPDFGILTNIGLAHLASMGNRETIAAEKMRLFAAIPASGWVILPSDCPLIDAHASALQCRVVRLGDPELPRFGERVMVPDGQVSTMRFPTGESAEVSLHTRSPELSEDLLFAASAAYLLGVPASEILERIDKYRPQPTRMEFWRSSEGVLFINDACSSDPTAVAAAIQATALTSSNYGRRIFVFGGMKELGDSAAAEHDKVGVLAASAGFDQVCLIGESADFSQVERGYQRHKLGEVCKLRDLTELSRHLAKTLRPGDTVLFKGPRGTGLAQAARSVAGSRAQRRLEVDLGAVAENILRIKRHCGAPVRVLAMAKALAYGTQLGRLGYWISKIGIRDIGVSSTAEGIQLRKSGLDSNIFVFLADRDDAENLLRYRLTPILYSAEFARHLASVLRASHKRIDAHLKIDTGMHRLGVDPQSAVAIAQELRESGAIQLTGVCTHFAAADDPSFDEFTRQQIATFEECLRALRIAGFDDLLAHAANTSATARFPEAHFDMVRVGLGLYGVYPSPAVADALALQLAIGVTSRVVGQATFAAGERFGYQRSFLAERETRVGVVPFGYADGLPRSTATRGVVLVDGVKVPVIGAISMDQMQVDLTDAPDADVGSEVLLYGTHNGFTIRPEDAAFGAKTIPHELLVWLGDRVERVFIGP